MAIHQTERRVSLSINRRVAKEKLLYSVCAIARAELNRATRRTVSCPVQVSNARSLYPNQILVAASPGVLVQLKICAASSCTTAPLQSVPSIRGTVVGHRQADATQVDNAADLQQSVMARQARSEAVPNRGGQREHNPPSVFLHMKSCATLA